MMFTNCMLLERNRIVSCRKGSLHPKLHRKSRNCDAEEEEKKFKILLLDLSRFNSNQRKCLIFLLIESLPLPSEIPSLPSL